MATPKSDEDQKRDEVLRRMLNTPHKKHEPLKPKTNMKKKKSPKRAPAG